MLAGVLVAGCGGSGADSPATDAAVGTDSAADDPAAPTAAESTVEGEVASVFETIEVGNDWCLSQTILPGDVNGQSQFWRRLPLSPRGDFFIRYGENKTEFVSLSDGSVQQVFSGGFFNGFVGESDWGWFHASGEDAQLWSEATGPIDVPIEPRSEIELISAPSSVAADGSVVAITAYPEGAQDAAPLVDTRIIDVDNSEDLGVFPDNTEVLPDGERIVVPLISDSFQQDEWSVQDLATGEELARLPGWDRVTISPDGQWLFTHLSDYAADGADQGTAYAFAISDPAAAVATFPGRVLRASPDGRFVFTVAAGSYDDNGNRLDTFGLWETATGEAVINEFTAAGGLTNAPFDFSHDSLFAAAWTETEAGIGVHVFDLEAGQVLTVIPANADPAISFDPNDDTLYVTDRRTGQFGHVDLSDGTVIVGESLFSFLNYQAVSAANGTAVYPAPDGSWILCELRTAEDGPGDGSGPDLPIEPADQGITRDMVLNALIPPGHCQEVGTEAVQLVDGELFEQFDGWRERTWIEGDDPDRLVIGDLDGDGFDDAVFVLTCNYGGNANFESVFVWIAGRDLQAVSLDSASQGLGYGGGFLSHMSGVEVSGSVVRVSWLGNLRDDGTCCPSVDMVSVFRVSRLGHLHFLRNEAQNEASVLYEELSA